jgi:hypothetical protein
VGRGQREPARELASRAGSRNLAEV